MWHSILGGISALREPAMASSGLVQTEALAGAL